MKAPPAEDVLHRVGNTRFLLRFVEDCFSDLLSPESRLTLTVRYDVRDDESPVSIPWWRSIRAIAGAQLAH